MRVMAGFGVLVLWFWVAKYRKSARPVLHRPLMLRNEFAFASAGWVSLALMLLGGYLVVSGLLG